MREIDDDIRALEAQRDAKIQAAATDFGPDRAYFALQDACIERAIDKYTYKLCAFADVKQDHTLLGKWSGWSTQSDGAVDYAHMRFANGYKCWNGPERCVRVSLLRCRVSLYVLSLAISHSLSLALRVGRCACSSSVVKRMRSQASTSPRRASTT